MKKIVLTGGGTAGHVNPNIALLPRLKEAGYKPYYIGSHNGIEKTLIKEVGVPYYPISTGKLRRYFDLKNFTDPFRVIKGFSEAHRLISKIDPDIIFSKGGYVSVPVVMAAKRLGIPVIIHESDFTPGLANKISFKFAGKICCSFPETVEMLPSDRAVLTGSPIRSNLTEGNAKKGLEFCGLSDEKPVILAMGGSIGAAAINKAIRENLDWILEKYQIIHLCGKNQVDSSLLDIKGYSQFEYINKELPDVFATASLVISRAGANAIFELLALRVPHILIPLPATSSRGDQLLNAESFKSQGYSYVLQEEDITTESLETAISYVFENKSTFVSAMNQNTQKDAVSIIIDLIKSESH